MTKPLRYLYPVAAIFLSVALSGCAGQTSKASQAYNESKEINTFESYSTFLNEYPDSSFALEAERLREGSLWDKVKKENTLEYYNIYLHEYPKGKFARNAKEGINKISMYKDLFRSKTLTQAIAAAEKRGRGKAINAKFETDGQGAHYKVKVLGSGSLVTYTMDPDTCKVLDTSDEPVENLFDRYLGAGSPRPKNVRETLAFIALTTRPPTGLAWAISTAEQNYGGKAIKVGVHPEGMNVVSYAVTTVEPDGSEHEINLY